MRSMSRSKCSRVRASVRAPYGDSSMTSTARSNSVRARSRWPRVNSRSPASKCRCEDSISVAMGSGGGTTTGAGACGGATATEATCGFGFEPHAAEMMRSPAAVSAGSHARVVIPGRSREDLAPTPRFTVTRAADPVEVAPRRGAPVDVPAEPPCCGSNRSYPKRRGLLLRIGAERSRRVPPSAEARPGGGKPTEIAGAASIPLPGWPGQPNPNILNSKQTVLAVSGRVIAASSPARKCDAPRRGPARPASRSCVRR